LLEVVFYLINIGYLTQTWWMQGQPAGLQQAIGMGVEKMGPVLVILGIAASIDLYLLTRMSISAKPLGKEAKTCL
jgi:hypothetical protein